MRAFHCDHCNQVANTTDFTNRRPIGWSTVRIEQSKAESGARHLVEKERSVHELCSSCTKEMRKFMDQYGAAQ